MENKRNEEMKHEHDAKDENILGHLLRTGLPPGIAPNEAVDPGNMSPKPGETPRGDNS